MNAMRCLVLALSVGVVSLLQGASTQAAKTPREALLVLSKHDHTLAIVDPATLRVVARVPSGDDPHEVIASSDGKFAYISNYGFGALHTLTAVDLMAQRTVGAIDLGALRGPHGLVFAGGKVWFTAEGAKAIGSYDPLKQQVDWVLGTGQDRTHMIYVAPDLKHIFTTNVSSATVTIAEKGAPRDPGSYPPGPGGPGGPGPGGPGPGGPGGPGGRRPMGPPGGDWEETVIAVGRGSEGFDVSPDGKEMWVANAADGTVSIIDIAGKKVTETLGAEFRGANRLKFTPDGKQVFISAMGLAVVDAVTHKEVKRLDNGQGGAGIQMQPDGKRVYAAYGREGVVAAIDLKTLQVVGKVDAGKEPDGLAWVSRR